MAHGFSTFLEKRKYIEVLAKGPGVAPVINSSEKGLIIFGIVSLSSKLKNLLKQA